MAHATVEHAVNPDLAGYPAETLIAAAKQIAPHGTDWKAFADRVECTVAKDVPGMELPVKQLLVIPSGKILSRLDTATAPKK